MTAASEQYTAQSEYFDDLCISADGKQQILDISGVEVSCRVDNNYPQIVTITYENKEYPCIITTDSQGNTIVSYSGYTYPAQIFSRKEQALRQIINSSEAKSNSTVKISAPMPGLIKTIFVTSGSRVKKGETLFLLEAMKMENSLKSPVAGIVGDIQISEGDAVRENFHLCSVKQV